MSFRVGTTITATCTALSGGALYAPDSYELRVRAPDGTIYTPTLTPVSTGTYVGSFTPAEGEAGLWRLEWSHEDSSGNTFAVGDSFKVDGARF